MSGTAVAGEVLAVLDGALKVDGKRVFIVGGQLPRKLYQGVNAVLEALGGKWDRKAKVHLFVEEPAEALEVVLATGRYVDPKKAFGYFPTPAPIADLVAEALGPASGDPRVLEPSAGDGALVQAILRAKAAKVSDFTLVEVDGGRAAKLTREFSAARVYGNDFVATDPYDRQSWPRVAMNPPFAKSQDVQHILCAWNRWLAPGGRLVAIASAGLAFRETANYRELRALIANHGSMEALPEDAFAESGTGVRTVLISMVKP